MNPVTWSRYSGYQINSKSDKRFSAFNAFMLDGRSIEEHYQCDVKGYISIRDGKGKPPLNLSKDAFTEYLNLWRIWSTDNKKLLVDLFSKVQKHNCVLGDFFATSKTNQANALSIILNEEFLGYKRTIIYSKGVNHDVINSTLTNCDLGISTVVVKINSPSISAGEQFAVQNNLAVEKFKNPIDNATFLICIWPINDSKNNQLLAIMRLAKSKKLKTHLFLVND
jgi:hypothetical protein